VKELHAEVNNEEWQGRLREIIKESPPGNRPLCRLRLLDEDNVRLDVTFPVDY